MNYKKIDKSDNAAIAKIVRHNLEKARLNIPGTVYFDKGLDNLSEFYNAAPDKRVYYIAKNDEGETIGGIGIAEFDGFEGCAEIQKLYLTDKAKGKGYGKQLMSLAEEFALKAGYKLLYLETHTNLATAVKMYEKLGFREIEKPKAVVHSTMNRFYIKELQVPY